VATDAALPAQRGALLALLGDGSLDLPLAGQGRTRERWQRLSAWGAQDQVLGRLAEGHTDAVAVLAEAGRPPPKDRLLGVWASANEGTGLRSQRVDGGWVLGGTLRFASGSRVLDGALVTAETPSGRILALVEVADLDPQPGTWQAVGMADSDSLDVHVEELRVADDDVVGPPGFYVDRPGLAIGGIGVAAVWCGGAAGVLDRVVHMLAGRSPGPHVRAHVGACWSAVRRGHTLLDAAADAVDADPAGDHRRLALHVRHEVERVVAEVLERAGRATGATPLCRDADYARLTTDLTVYVRQHHAERDLEGLGDSALAGDALQAEIS